MFLLAPESSGHFLNFTITMIIIFHTFQYQIVLKFLAIWQTNQYLVYVLKGTRTLPLDIVCLLLFITHISYFNITTSVRYLPVAKFGINN